MPWLTKLIHITFLLSQTQIPSWLSGKSLWTSLLGNKQHSIASNPGGNSFTSIMNNSCVIPLQTIYKKKSDSYSGGSKDMYSALEWPKAFTSTAENYEHMFIVPSN